MENKEISNRLLAVASKLEELEVRGSGNMMLLMSCIRFLQETAKEVRGEADG